MKKILFIISLLSLILQSGTSANDKITVRYVDTLDGSPDHFVYRENTETNTNTLLFTLPIPLVDKHVLKQAVDL